MAYSVTFYTIHRYRDGHDSVVSKGEEDRNEEQVKHLKKVNKRLGYKYLGRYKDYHDKYYTLYERKDVSLSTSKRDIIFVVKITKLW